MTSHKYSLTCAIFGFLLTLGGTYSPAYSLTYNLTNVTFADGASATGSFVIDSASGFFPTNVNISTSSSQTFVGVSSYNSGGILNPINVPNGYYFYNPTFPNYFLYFQLDTNLSLLPAAANIVPGPTGFSLEENGSSFRNISTGRVTALSAPEPTTSVLLAFGVAVVYRFRQSRLSNRSSNA